MSTPFHTGELTVQRRAGVEEDAARVGRIIADQVAPAIGKVLQRMHMGCAASIDGDGRVWASLLTGRRGFAEPVDATLVLLRAVTAPGDPLTASVHAPRELGVLLIDLESRVRVRLNGRALADADRGLFLSVRQVYANCPQYITPRRVEWDAARLTTTTRSPSLAPDVQRMLAGADTFFIASACASGADASHRGGPPGFLRVLDASTVAFDDAPGNNMFNTLGNLTVNPRAGLLVPDFATGSMVQVTGSAAVSWTAGRATVTMSIDEVLSHHARVAHQKA
jgi:uncharacterized protein